MLRRWLWLALGLVLIGTSSGGYGAETLIPLGSSQWKYRKGNSPPAGAAGEWRGLRTADTDWAIGSAPFYYGENLGAGTVLGDMRNGYTTLYLRHPFVIGDLAEAEPLALRVLCDDGFILWLNGREVVRYNVADGEPSPTSVARSAIEPIWVTNILREVASYLVRGTNMAAVQVFNQALTSSDLVLDLALEAVADKIAPAVVSLAPAPGTVTELRSVVVTFSESVAGVDANDLLVNNTPAARVSGSGARYTFEFAQPEFGVVDITFEDGHHITDLALPPLALDAASSAGIWRYQLVDRELPRVIAATPPAGSTVRALTQIEVRFSEPVRGVDATDLQLGGRRALAMNVLSPTRFIFQFEAATAGSVMAAWSSAHGIQDEATPANAFAGGTWSYTIDPNAAPAHIVMSEFLAASEATGGLRDEDGELQDWIEVHNAGATSANLAGWSLSDDRSEPDRWVFPDRALAPGARLVVFASGKDRREPAPGAVLHTNFKLNAAGEFLALYSAESPRRAVTEFADDYPEQRPDISYGLTAAGGWRYYATATPGQPNGSSTLSGLVPRPTVSRGRGLYDGPLDVALTNAMAEAVLRYTLDGSVPTATMGQVYAGPIRIATTTVLRAAAFRAGYLPSQTITHTYVVVPAVLVQPNDPAGFPVGTTVMAGYPSDYEMDPEIVNDPAYRDEMAAALRALPTLSIALKGEDMFGGANGIYTHPLSRGPQWERACSIEFIPVDGDDFQEDAGIQIQGNAAREPIKQPKHPLRVVFKGDYGKTRLDYRLFPDSPVTTFDTLILRADFNVSWLHWNPTQRIRGQRTRDAWMKDTMRAMGGLASHNRFVHLYINGVYWGVYEPSERPDGSFGAAYLGGQKEDYDVMNEGAVVDGSMAAYNAMLNLGGLENPAQYEAMKAYLDMPQFIDYMLLHFYGGHEDWGNNKNWYAVRPKDGSSGYKYVPWDGELILGDGGINRVANTDVPSGLHTKLLASAQYRLDFADRVRRHFFNDGALTPARNVERWLYRARQVELPIIAESARWGDYRRDVHRYSSAPYELYTRETHWRPEQTRLLTSYFPTRTATVLGQLRAAGLYPATAAPQFSQHGGRVTPGYRLSMTTSAGAIYFTTDGTDPRDPAAGAAAAWAARYTAPVVGSPGTELEFAL